MGPPPTKHPRPPSRSRFQEGSMNDRASAAPPVQFLGSSGGSNDGNRNSSSSSGSGGSTRDADVIDAALARIQSGSATATTTTTTTTTTITTDNDEKRASATNSIVSSSSRHESVDSGDTATAATAGKPQRRSKLLSQVWDGMFGKLRFGRKDGEEEGKAAASSSSSSSSSSSGAQAPSSARWSTSSTGARQKGAEEAKAADRAEGREQRISQEAVGGSNRGSTGISNSSSSGAGANLARPSRDDIMASYNDLVASGFFSAHAIPSARHPGSRPSTARPASSHNNAETGTTSFAATVQDKDKTTVMEGNSRRPITRSASSTFGHHRRQQQAPPRESGTAFSPPPQWPLLASPQTPQFVNHTHHLSPIRSPASACSLSRGTKRAAVDDDEEEQKEDGSGGRDVDGDTSMAAAGPTEAASRPSMAKKLRKTTSRDVALPKLRSKTSRRALLGRRSASNIAANPPDYAPPPPPVPPREPKKLTKRVPSRGSVRGSLDIPAAAPIPVPERGSSARRRGGMRDVSSSAITSPSSSTAAPHPQMRVLRPRRSADAFVAKPLSVVPDANRGIPTVPDIPPKFTYGEDRENDGPWRGLRR